jgi:phosphotransferase system enzyme I (PtsP)
VKGKEIWSKDFVKALRVLTSQLANILEGSRLLICMPEGNDAESYIEAWKNLSFLKGKVASPGFAMAEAIIFDKVKSLGSFRTMLPSQSFSSAQFEAALEKTEEQLEALQEREEQDLRDVASLIFSAHLLMLKDDNFTGKMRGRMRRGMDVGKAVVKTAKEFIGRFSQAPDPYIAEKAYDVEDLTIRLLQNMIGDSAKDFNVAGHIIIASKLSPTALLQLHSEGVAGIVLTSGGITGHISILCQSLKIPLIIIDHPALLFIPKGIVLYLDSENERIQINPDEDAVAEYKRHKSALKSGHVRDVLGHPVVTTDGTPIQVMINVNLYSDVASAKSFHVGGVGLYRTEFPFILRLTFPSEEEQYFVYRTIVENAPQGPITFRTLDIGGDKALSYYYQRMEQNPFLGMRSTRFTIEHPSIFIAQLKAILRAGLGADLRIMFPMISSLDEYAAAKAMLDRAREELDYERVPYHKTPQVGLMVEIPSAVDIINDLVREADFISIGSNDLVQYMLAVDRTNEKVAKYYIPHHPAVLRALSKIVSAAANNKKEVTICGDIAHSEHYLPFLIGIGLRCFSVSTGFIEKTKRIISNVNVHDSKELAKKVLAESSIRKIERFLGLAL